MRREGVKKKLIGIFNQVNLFHPSSGIPLKFNPVFYSILCITKSKKPILFTIFTSDYANNFNFKSQIIHHLVCDYHNDHPADLCVSIIISFLTALRLFDISWISQILDTRYHIWGVGGIGNGGSWVHNSGRVQICSKVINK